MNQKFNKFGVNEIPVIRVRNPNGKSVGFLNSIYNMKLRLCFNEMSEFSFTIPSAIDGSHHEAYDTIQTKRQVEIEGIGIFIINSVTETNDGYTPVKDVIAYSLEAELNYKKVNLSQGTYKFYDIFSPEKSLMGFIISTCPGWTIGQIDVDLYSLYRTFEIPDSTLYQFMMDDVENAYECIFTFDTFNKKINAIATKNIKGKTDIFLSFDNLLKNIKIEEMSDEIVTALKVYGGGDLDIRAVNPLGTASVYDFSFYMNTKWMTQELISAIERWEAKILLLQVQYAEILVAIKDNNSVIITLSSEHAELQAEYLALEGVQKVRIEQGLGYSDINLQMRLKQSQINAKQALISDCLDEQESLNEQRSSINQQLSFSENFTEEEYIELSSYIIENTYQNDSFIRTSEMTNVEIQEMAQELYDQALKILDKSSQPRYTFDMESVNFLYLKEFKAFTDQLTLGSMVNIEIEQGKILKPVLLQIEYALDDPEEFTLTFGNRFRLDSNEFIFSDLFSDAIKGGTSVKFDSQKWSDWVQSGSKNDVTEFINSALDTSKNNVINAVNQEILINQNGLRGRTSIPDSTNYLPTQCWLTSNTLAFTKDSWNTSSLALGEIEFNGQKIFGIVGEAIIGNLLAGNSLHISNEKNNFTLDENGASLYNASFTLEGSDGKSKIILDPSVGIKIQGRSGAGSQFQDRMYMDNYGNLQIVGDINANGGTIGGWHIDDTRIYDDYGNYIDSDGTGVLGGLKYGVGTGDEVNTFSGDVRFNSCTLSSLDYESGWLIADNSRLGYASCQKIGVWEKMTIGDGVLITAGDNTEFAMGSYSTFDVGYQGKITAANAEVGYLNVNGNLNLGGYLVLNGRYLSIYPDFNTRTLKF